MAHEGHGPPTHGPYTDTDGSVACVCGRTSCTRWEGERFAEVPAPAPAWESWAWGASPRPRRPVLADELRRLAARLDGPEYLGRERLAEIAGSLRTVAVVLDGEGPA